MKTTLPILLLGLLVQTASAVSNVEFYGFVLPVWTMGSSGIESFGQPNMTAYTAAGNPVTQTARESARSAFHVGQSRAGVLVRPFEKVSARLEFDFVDFSKATPTTTQLPRVRRAYVEIPVAENVTFAFGQDWDIVSPLAPHSFNYVGHLFESGDIAFMRLQARVAAKVNDWEHAVAIGFPTATTGASDTVNELGVLPVLEASESLALSSSTKIGLSGVIGWLRKNLGSSDRFLAGALTAFLSSFVNPNLELRSEIYFARNSYNLGMLGLSFSNGTNQPSEAGAYISARWALGNHALFGTLGSAWILNPAEVLAAYSPTTLASTSSGPGMERNSSLRLGYEYSLNPSCTLFTELAFLNTHHHLAAANSGTVPVTQAFINQTGVQVKL